MPKAATTTSAAPMLTNRELMRNQSTKLSAFGWVVSTSVTGVVMGLHVIVTSDARRSAPGVTRTPGQRFRKPLLYPPELRGQQVGLLDLTPPIGCRFFADETPRREIVEKCRERSCSAFKLRHLWSALPAGAVSFAG